MTTNDANQTSLLARIAGKFAYHPENVATEALGHILRYEGALRILGLTLLDGGVDGYFRHRAPHPGSEWRDWGNGVSALWTKASGDAA